MITLALDAATYQGSVAVLEEDRVLVQRTTEMRGRDAERLMPAVDMALKDAGMGIDRIERIVCGGGPGSFTSLRIAASIAKGLAIGRGLSLFAVSSLALVVAGNVSDGPRGVRRYLAALDAMRGDSYVQELEHLEGCVRITAEPRLMRSEMVVSAAEGLGARAVGPDLPQNWSPHARGVALLLESILASKPVDLSSWEPMYGRMAEAQVKWEAEHGRPLPT
jgi:tRNA threonylcarbamoyladenosine biosynthesis protein TsaB